MVDAAPGYQAYYLTAGRAAAWIVVIAAVFGAVDIVHSGQTRPDRAALLVIGAACLLSYILGMRPAVLEEVEGVCVRNPLRTCLIPWGAVTNVDVTDVLRVHAKDAVVRCFAVPRRRPRPRLPALGLGRPPSDFGFSDLTGVPSTGVHSGTSRAELVAARLRSRAEGAPTGTADPTSPRLAADAAWVLAAAMVLLVLAVAL